MKRPVALFAIACGVMLVVAPQVVDAATTCCTCTPKDDPKRTICIQTAQTSCDGLENVTGNASIKQLGCHNAISEGACKPITDGGLCLEGPSPENAYLPSKTSPPTSGGTSGGGSTSDYQAPTLNVPIPGLTLTDAQPVDAVLRIPWFAEYIAGIQRYLLSFAAIAAAIAIIYGGFRYITGSAMESVARGKEIIRDAVIGLMLLFGAYTILYTINPATVSPTPLDLQLVHRLDAFSDPALERARVVDSARVKPGADADVTVPIIDLGAPATPAPSAGGATSSAPTLQPGDIATNPQGGLIAQGDCPLDMVAIKHSDTYPQAKVSSFCIDRYEAPDQKGVKPFAGVSEYEADWYCNERGKRLCNEDEWVRACLGPDGKNTYGYGPEYIVGLWTQPDKPGVPAAKPGGSVPAPCNYDSPIPPNVYTKSVNTVNNVIGTFSVNYQTKNPQQSILNPNDPRLAKPAYKKDLDAYLAGINLFDYLIEPSGNDHSPTLATKCVTAEGVWDMVGNTQEIVVASNAKNLTTEQRVARGTVNGANKPYTWMNFFFAPIAHNGENNGAVTTKPACTNRWGSIHAVGNRSYENGFRCCLDLNK